ncbi:hypothetical protein F5B17DRAFT_431593 [Nemania serpens]|nr:hypothetical protein F5B17DRAFT_431593 [Nemania serpens]
MGNPTTPTPCLIDEHHNNGSQEATSYANQPSPQVLIPPDSSNSEIPSHRVPSICMQPKVMVPSLSPQKIVRKPVPESAMEPNTQPKSIMALRLARMNDKWKGLKARACPKVYRFAGHAFLGIVIIIFASVILGWYGMAKDTVSHEGTAAAPTKTAMEFPPYYEPFCPASTLSSDGQPCILPHTAPTNATPATTTTPPDDIDTVTVTVMRTVTDTITHVKTVTTVAPIVVTVSRVHTTTAVYPFFVTSTRVHTVTAVKTSTTTAFVFTCATDFPEPTITISAEVTDTSTSTSKPTSTSSNSVMTGLMYCTFTGRPNVYTLCPHVHTDSPGRLPSAPVVDSAGTHGAKNPFGAARIKITSLWNSIPGLGKCMRGKGEEEEDRSGGGDGGSERERDCDCDCDCAEMKRNLEETLDLVVIQQRVIDRQRALINEHKEKLIVALQALLNVTSAAARIRRGAVGGQELNLNI